MVALVSRRLVMKLTLSAASLLPLAPRLAFADTPLTDEEINDIATTAYLYFYPAITIDVTRRQYTNVEPGKEFGKGPVNTFTNIPAYPPADFKGVVRSNFDTLYSIAWLDLSEEPIVLSLPDTDGRYYLMPMLDAWSDVFASPGWRTTGTGPGTFVIAPQGWEPKDLPEGASVIEAPTPYVWIIGRTKTDGPKDYEAVHKIQAGYRVVPLSKYGTDYTPPPVKIDPSIDMKTPPKTTVDTMGGEDYFTYAADLLKKIPPHVTDGPIIDQLGRLGFVAGETLDFSKLDPKVQAAFIAAPAAGQQLMKWKVPSLARVANGWSMNTDTMGVYGNYYLKRAIIAQYGLGANLPEDAIYPLNLVDGEGKPLDGASDNYRIHFDKGKLPPANAFWSITLYDSDGFQVANTLDRFAVSSWMPFVRNGDGSLDLYFQNESPGKEREANWLPAPKGPFNLTMRLYAPASDALTGKWNPPEIIREGGATDSPITAQ